MRLEGLGRALAMRQRGVTGLETAIILIAFVVVASVFGFTVLTTGIFSSERGHETTFAGLEQARGGIQLQGAIIANGVVDSTLSNAESAWIALSSVTSTQDSTDKKQGSYSGELAVASSKTGLLAYENISPALNLSSHDSIQLWVKSSVATTSGQLELVIDDTTGCSSPATNGERINLPALAANTWKKASVGITATTTRTAVGCVGLYLETALGSAGTLNFDEIFARGQATSVITTIANTVEGIAVDLTIPSDSDDDGLADSTDRRYRFVISYTDVNQKKDDMYWTKSFVGLNDSDDLLEEGERVEITISLKGLDQATPLVHDQEFGIELKPTDGSMVIIQRTIPSRIDTVMSLQ